MYRKGRQNSNQYPPPYPNPPFLTQPPYTPNNPHPNPYAHQPTS